SVMDPPSFDTELKMENCTKIALSIPASRLIVALRLPVCQFAVIQTLCERKGIESRNIKTSRVSKPYSSTVCCMFFFPISTSPPQDLGCFDLHLGKLRA